ncbi:MAG TPA: fumarylacetoacetase [Streptosporangiaceae bacterium]|nr:fumarylacetoacetase [Streptosporangiaceae bacterium]
MALPAACDWLEVPDGHPFGLQTLPYGSFSNAHHPARRRVGVAIGDKVLDLTTAVERLVPGRAADFSDGNLDRFLAAGDGAWAQVRADLLAWLSQDHFRSALEDLLVPADSVTMHLPFTVADYVDFYASEQHATNVGQMFRPDGEALQPNWRHLPVGYHGRAGTVLISGTPIRRPCGQTKPTAATKPVFGPSRRLDFEAELGFVVGVDSITGERVPASRFREHVFGACLVNDWSARDIQGWESAPLGPFLGKSFGTTLSPWIVPLAALEHARVRPPSLDTELVDYLADSGDWGFDIDFEVMINGHVVSRPPYSTMFWSPAQMLAHLTVNGASLRTGDLFASGTVSGPEPDQYGSLIELAWAGRRPLTLGDGSTRSWLEDGDEIRIRATAAGQDGTRVGFGDVHGQILPAWTPEPGLP